MAYCQYGKAGSEEGLSMSKIPTDDVDIYSDEVVLEPYAHYRRLRNLGPAVWLNHHQVWAIVRYEELRAALRNGKVFSSAQGVMLNEPMNEATQGIMLCSNDPEHRAIRQIFAEPLLPDAIGPLKGRLKKLAEPQIERLINKKSFDAVTELAHFLPLTVVSELVGLNEEGRENMLKWASGIFNAFGPLPNERTQAGINIMQEVMEYLANRAQRDTLRPGGWGARLYDCADQGLITQQQVSALLIDYLTPSLDTTIHATSNLISLFGENPEQWDRVRADHSLIGNAIEEGVRLESPIRSFGRYIAEDKVMGGITLKKGSRSMMIYASANRDERKWSEPERFDVTRNVIGHLGFGHGTHICAGLYLARLEISVLLELLVDKVERFELGANRRVPHNTLRGYHTLMVSVH